MRILIYNWRDIKNPDGGGAEIFTHEIAKRIVEKGNHVTWFTAGFNGCQKEEYIDGIRIIRDGNKYTVYLKAREYYKKYFTGNFDIIIDEINTIPFMTPKFVKGEKIIALIHQLAREFWFYETPLPVAIIGRYFLEDYWLKMYKDIPTFTVSNSSREDLIKLGFNNIFIIPEGIDFKPLIYPNQKEKDPTFIFCGRLKKAKLPDHAIKAFKLVKNKIKNAKLWIVGDGYYKKDLEKMAGDGIVFFGKLDQKQKLELMSRAWAILVPGIREGWGLIVTEANAMGTPAIGYNVPGLRDSIKNSNGILVEPKIEKMASTVVNFISNKELIEKLSIKAIDISKQFSWDRSTEEILNCIERIYKNK